MDIGSVCNNATKQRTDRITLKLLTTLTEEQIMKNKIKNIIKRLNKRTCLIILMGCLALLGSLVVANIILEGSVLKCATFKGNHSEEQFVRNLTSGMSIKQTFQANHDFEFITLYCSDHDMSIQGQTIISVTDTEDENIVAYERLDNYDIKYGIPVKVYFSGIEGKKYTVTIRAENTIDDGIGFFGYLPHEDDETALVNGEKSEYVLDIGLNANTKVFIYLSVIVLVVMLAGLVVIIYFLCKKVLNPKNLFLMLAIPLGIVFLCFLNVNYLNDGDTHFAKVYHYSNVILGIEDQSDGNAITMRKDDLDTVYSSDTSVAANAQNMYHILENWNWFASDTSLVEGVEWRNAGITNIVEYFPAALVFAIGRLLGFGIYPIILFAKIITFISYLVGIYYAIKIMPIGRHLMAFCGALPLALREATGFTYDTAIVVATFLLIAIIFRSYYVEINRQLLIIATICCIILGLSKEGIYTPVALLFCVIPKEKWGGVKKKWLCIALLAAITFATAMTQYGSLIKGVYESETTVAQSEANDSDDSTSKTVTYYGFTYALREPKNFTKMCINTVMEQIQSPIMGMLGQRVPWAENKLPLWSFGLFGVALLLSKNGIGEEQYRVGKPMRMGMLGVTLLIYLAYLVSFLVITPIGFSYVWGIQGRYFIPLLPILLLTYRNNGCKQEMGSESVLCLAYYFCMMLYAICYLKIFMTHY